MRACIFFIENWYRNLRKRFKKHPAGTSQAPDNSSTSTPADSAPIQQRYGTDEYLRIVLFVIAFAAFFMLSAIIAGKADSALIQKNHIPMANEPQPRRLDLFNADVRLISDCSDTTAARRIAECKDALGKQVHQVLTIKEYCTYYGYDYKEVLAMLKLI